MDFAFQPPFDPNKMEWIKWQLVAQALQVSTTVSGI